MEMPVIEGDSPVHVHCVRNSSTLSRAGHVKSCLNLPDHLVRLNTPGRPIVYKYREGKVKSTPNRG